MYVCMYKIAQYKHYSGDHNNICRRNVSFRTEGFCVIPAATKISSFRICTDMTTFAMLNREPNTIDGKN